MLNLMSITRKADFEGILHDRGQKFCGGLSTKDGARKPCCQKVGETSDMVDMDMCEHQTAQVVDVEVNFERLVCFAALEKTAVDEQSATVREPQFVAGTCDAAVSAVVDD